MNTSLDFKQKNKYNKLKKKYKFFEQVSNPIFSSCFLIWIGKYATWTKAHKGSQANEKIKIREEVLYIKRLNSY